MTPIPGGGIATLYVRSRDLKMLREALCIAQSRIFASDLDRGRQERDVRALEHLIHEIDLHRPLGPDGKHGNRHTATCGCDDR